MAGGRRGDGRRADELRGVRIEVGFLRNCPSSVLIEMGATRVVCSATVEEKVPGFLARSGRGWVTGEYGMLPGSTVERKARERRHVGGRTAEIERLIGRSLRAVVDFEKLGERTVRVDCDVLDADGGTRTAAITGAYVALAEAVRRLGEAGLVAGEVIREPLAAVSVGVVEGRALLDLCYAEDAAAEVDMNLVMTGTGKFVEIQGTAEGKPFGEEELDRLLGLGKKGIRRLIRIQKEALKGK